MLMEEWEWAGFGLLCTLKPASPWLGCFGWKQKILYGISPCRTKLWVGEHWNHWAAAREEVSFPSCPCEVHLYISSGNQFWLCRPGTRMRVFHKDELICAFALVRKDDLLLRVLVWNFRNLVSTSVLPCRTLSKILRELQVSEYMLDI